MIEKVLKSDWLIQILKDHRENIKVFNKGKINFIGQGDEDVYNISQEFEYKGKLYIAGRCEGRNSEISKVSFFEKINENTFKLDEDCTIKDLQDPSVTIFDDKILLAGTEIFYDDNRINNWHTSFYIGEELNSLKKIINCPDKMKDVRIAKNGEFYYVFTRPQGGTNGPGKIGFFKTRNIKDVTIDNINKAIILDDLFPRNCWGGVNQIHFLKNGRIGIVGHIAIMSDNDVRHYYGMVFTLDENTLEHSEVKIICERCDFDKGDYKRKDLIDVVFMGGLNRNKDNTATIYTGLSDAEAHYMIIKDPFLEYEE